jgi:hypothetical protein
MTDLLPCKYCGEKKEDSTQTVTFAVCTDCKIRKRRATLTREKQNENNK